MPYKTGSWGTQAQERSKRRKEYWRKRDSKKIKKRGNSSAWKCEEIASNLLSGCTWFRSTKKPTDLEWNGYKIDVKSSELYKGKYWSFSISRQKKVAHYFLCISLVKGVPQRAYLIPNKNIPNTVIIISKKKRQYERYLLKEWR